MSSGIPIILSAPSGGGKSTIAEKILQEWPKAIRSISCTTRAPRGEEKNGVDYLFINEVDFKLKIKKNDFVEWAWVHDHLYGTPKVEFDKNLLAGCDVLLVIDPQGAVNIKKLYPEGVFIFILPSTWFVLRERLQKRAADSDEDIKKRLENAKMEFSFLPYYQYLVVNDVLDVAVSDVMAIIRAEHRRLNRVNKREIPILLS